MRGEIGRDKGSGESEKQERDTFPVPVEKLGNDVGTVEQ